MRKYDTISTGIKGIIAEQGIQSPLSDQSCPSTTDWYKGIQGILGIQRMQGIQGLLGIQRIKGIIGIQSIQSPISDQSCPSTTDWFKGIQGILGIQRIQGQFLGK